MHVTFKEIISAVENGGVLVDISTIKEKQTLSSAGIDSLEIMGFFLAIEEKFKVKFPDEDIDSLQSINDIIHYMERF